MLKDLDIDETTFMHFYSWYSDFPCEKCTLNYTFVVSQMGFGMPFINYLTDITAKMSLFHT